MGIFVVWAGTVSAASYFAIVLNNEPTWRPLFSDSDFSSAYTNVYAKNYRSYFVGAATLDSTKEKFKDIWEEAYETSTGGSGTFPTLEQMVKYCAIEISSTASA